MRYQGGYRAFVDIAVRSAGEATPTLHSQWIIWRSMIIRFHLFEIAGVNDWDALIALFEARGMRRPLCHRRIPLGELTRPGWGTPNPDRLLWFWRWIEKMGLSPNRLCRTWNTSRGRDFII